MYESIKDRVISVGNYMLNSKKTIREIADIYGVSKSTIHKDLSERLKNIDNELYSEVSIIIENHIKTRHIKGGKSTKEKYLRLKERRE